MILENHIETNPARTAKLWRTGINDYAVQVKTPELVRRLRGWIFLKESEIELTGPRRIFTFTGLANADEVRRRLGIPPHNKQIESKGRSIHDDDLPF